MSYIVTWKHPGADCFVSECYAHRQTAISQAQDRARITGAGIVYVSKVTEEVKAVVTTTIETKEIQ